MNQALLSKQATEENTPFPYGTIHAEIPGSSPAAVAIGLCKRRLLRRTSPVAVWTSATYSRIVPFGATPKYIPLYLYRV
jgi:hypothetical protein